jgi:hypothetical protein
MSEIREITLREFLRNPKGIYPIPTSGITIKCRDRDSFRIMPMSDIPAPDVRHSEDNVRPSIAELRETIDTLENKSTDGYTSTISEVSGSQSWGSMRLHCQVCQKAPAISRQYDFDDGSGTGSGFFCKTHSEAIDNKKSYSVDIPTSPVALNSRPFIPNAGIPIPKPKKKEKKHGK